MPTPCSRFVRLGVSEEICIGDVCFPNCTGRDHMHVYPKTLLLTQNYPGTVSHQLTSAGLLFVAPRAVDVHTVTVAYGRAATSACTLTILKLANGSQLAEAVPIHQAPLDLTLPAYQAQRPVLSTAHKTVFLQAGDMLCYRTTGNLGGLRDLTLSLELLVYDPDGHPPVIL